MSTPFANSFGRLSAESITKILLAASTSGALLNISGDPIDSEYVAVRCRVKFLADELSDPTIDDFKRMFEHRVGVALAAEIDKLLGQAIDSLANKATRWVPRSDTALMGLCKAIEVACEHLGGSNWSGRMVAVLPPGYGCTDVPPQVDGCAIRFNEHLRDKCLVYVAENAPVTLSDQIMVQTGLNYDLATMAMEFMVTVRAKVPPIHQQAVVVELP